MGMYTELFLTVELSKDTREDIVKWLFANNDLGEECNVGTWEDLVSMAPKELKGTRLDTLTGGSYYFDGIPFTKFKYDKISKSYFLTLLLNIKNYSDEISTFLKLLEPYVTSNGHVGHRRYEEAERPEILYYVNGAFGNSPAEEEDCSSGYFN